MFDPAQELLPGELVWILDEVLRLEVCFLLAGLRQSLTLHPRRQPSKTVTHSSARFSPAITFDLRP